MCGWAWRGESRRTGRSAAGDDADNLQPVAVPKGLAGELAGGDGLAVELHHDAAREEPGALQKLPETARRLDGPFPAVGDNLHAGELKAGAGPRQDRTVAPADEDLGETKA